LNFFKMSSKISAKNTTGCKNGLILLGSQGPLHPCQQGLLCLQVAERETARQSEVEIITTRLDRKQHEIEASGKQNAGVRQVSKELGRSTYAISMYCRGKRKHCGEAVWKEVGRK
jgi:hypothetical protein